MRLPPSPLAAPSSPADRLSPSDAVGRVPSSPVGRLSPSARRRSSATEWRNNRASTMSSITNGNAPATSNGCSAQQWITSKTSQGGRFEVCDCSSPRPTSAEFWICQAGTCPPYGKSLDDFASSLFAWFSLLWLSRSLLDLDAGSLQRLHVAWLMFLHIQAQADTHTQRETHVTCKIYARWGVIILWLLSSFALPSSAFTCADMTRELWPCAQVGP